MSDIHKGEGVDRLRKQLYSRDPQNQAPEPIDTTTQYRTERPQVTGQWQQPPQPRNSSSELQRMSKKYRKRIVFAGVFFFFLALIVSSVSFFFTAKGISGENINVSATGPFTIAAGDTFPLQISINNHNNVALESAVLIVRYPEGTKTADGSFKDVSVERIPIDGVGAGQSVNIPVRAIVFGEEDSSHTISAAIEYRVAGSNATFAKEGTLLRYKISSTPVIISVASNRQVSSGQTETVKLTIRSNSKSTIKNLVVMAEYPTGFEFISSDPQPITDDDIWLIEELPPETEAVIAINAEIFGQEADQLVTNFKVGLPQSNNFTQIASVFGETKAEFVIENPFIGLKFDLGVPNDGKFIVEPGESISGALEVTNAMNDAIYDVRVVTDLSGNALLDPAVKNTNGYFDQRNNTITWDPGDVSALKAIAPGKTVRLNFSIPVNKKVVTAPQINLRTNVSAERVSETSAIEKLQGTASADIRVTTALDILAEARKVKGPVPPKVDQETQYKITMRVDNGSNNISDAVLKTTIPNGVSFVEILSGQQNINFNENDRSFTWNIGSLAARKSQTVSFIVSIRPTISQVGEILPLVEQQQLTAKDDFTQVTVRAFRPRITTELSTELGFEEENGRVVQ